MPKLTPLLIDNESIISLADCKISSNIDFIQADLEKIVSNSNLNAEATLEIKHKLITNCSAVPVSAHSCYSVLMNRNVMKTDIEGLDNLLNGGIIKGTVLEFCGFAGSGKTQICHSLAINAAIKGVKVHYIDTKLDFSASRCNALLPENLSGMEMDGILENIKVSTPKNIYELISIIDTLNKSCNLSLECERMIIIDSITAPYLPLVGISSNKGFSLLNYIASSLKQLAFYGNCAVILTNLCANYFEVEEEELRRNPEEIKPFLGKYWLHVPNTRILICREAAFMTKRLLRILKSDYLDMKKTVEVNISETGVT